MRQLFRVEFDWRIICLHFVFVSLFSWQFIVCVRQQRCSWGAQRHYDIETLFLGTSAEELSPVCTGSIWIYMFTREHAHFLNSMHNIRKHCTTSSWVLVVCGVYVCVLANGFTVSARRGWAPKPASGKTILLNEYMALRPFRYMQHRYTPKMRISCRH